MAFILAALPALMGAGGAAAGAAGAAGGGIGIGTILSTVGTVYSGIRAMQAGKAQAAMLKQKGEQDIAIAQRKAAQSRKEKDMVLSRQRAVSAASGGSATDDSVKAIMGKTEAAGEGNALMDMYNGMLSKQNLDYQANVAKSEGNQAMVGSVISAGANLYGDFAKKKNDAAYYNYEGV